MAVPLHGLGKYTVDDLLPVLFRQPAEAGAVARDANDEVGVGFRALVCLQQPLPGDDIEVDQSTAELIVGVDEGDDAVHTVPEQARQ